MGKRGIFSGSRLAAQFTSTKTNNMFKKPQDRDASPVRSPRSIPTEGIIIPFHVKDYEERGFWLPTAADYELLKFHTDNLRLKDESGLDLSTQTKRLAYYLTREAVPESTATLQPFDPWNFAHCGRTTTDYAFDLLRLATEKQSLVAFNYFFSKLETPHPYQGVSMYETWRQYLFNYRSFYARAIATAHRNAGEWGFLPVFQVTSYFAEGYNPTTGEFPTPFKARTKQTARRAEREARLAKNNVEEDGKAEFNLRHTTRLCVVSKAGQPVAVCPSREDAITVLRSFLCTPHKCTGCTALPCPYYLDEKGVLELSPEYVIHDQVDRYKKNIY